MVRIAYFRRFPASFYLHLELIANPFSYLDNLRFGNAGDVMEALSRQGRHASRDMPGGRPSDR